MWRRLIYHPEVNYALRQTLVLCLPVAVGLILGHLQQGLLFSLVPACCNIAGLDTPHKRFFKRLIIGGCLFAGCSLAVQLLLTRDIPLPLILTVLAMTLGVTAEISSLHARLLPASLIAAIFTLSLAGNMPVWEPLLIYALGTLWYGLFNWFWFWMWREQPLRESLSLLYILLAYFVIVGTGNAVNLTDGLDGLAIMPTVFVAAGFALVAWATGNMNFANYLHIPYLRHAGELVIVCTAIVGAGLGFLWFNTYPAQVFMGDVGSLALGGALGIIAVLLRQEFLLVIMGGVFVVETLSVILQVGSFKLRGQRIFRMAPIHHHYELKGWPEPRVIVRFWIISLMLVLIGLATLKVR